MQQTRFLVRAAAASRRSLHSGNAYSVSASGWPAGVRGMDMTHAPGYRVAAEKADPPTPESRMADFAMRHGNLQYNDLAHAPGYLWVGRVLYPVTPEFITPEWDIEVSESINAPAAERTQEPRYTKRRYTGGQARRIRQQLRDVKNRRARKKAARRSKSIDGPPLSDES